ncbi:MAG TPA: GyrI-like domain-containing protein, partial [Cyclobacteriaceae bacterium]|nr:GyrI-like domain-containing protein [Cyclobacteriaceae bacterium]
MTATEYKPVTKQVQPINFLFFRTQTTLGQLGNFFHVANELYAEALKHKLSVTGPVHWHYVGFTDAGKPFTLEIALPVAEVLAEYDGQFHFKRTENFNCVSLIHEGDWLNITAGYEKLMRYASEHQLTPAGVNRELYVNVDFVNPQA